MICVLLQDFYFFRSNNFQFLKIYNQKNKNRKMSNQVRRPLAETSADHVERKTAKDIGQPIEKVKAESSTNFIKKQAEGITDKIEKAAKNLKETIMGSDNERKQNANMNRNENSAANKIVNDAKKMMKVQAKENEINWQESFKNASSDIKKSLKQGHSQFSSQLQKVYQGMLKNCLKQSQDEPHKLNKCWEQFSSKMQPVYARMQERTAESTESLKKCFESKRNAKQCIDEGIKFGQQSLHDATNSIKAYLA